ncbi:NAD(P)H-dependent oxidoreductase [Alteromonas sp. KC3]|uniref:NAD(P)H-dependent oxidoreductase n=1 Tax=unclassified Alteromonas TaxID=2614992 RepID=UPI00192490BB|nr:MULTISPECIES: NAD(P)H-dependent oxidoreductase [unclassified Alteromonas]BCO19577.1 NAD(P)H-dependent oxidoreductase [Alteromonas sp. KC3]BCO23542.1 NAD(P)H-dependent oxidoreductase [Alteromonas sp. KC14]
MHVIKALNWRYSVKQFSDHKLSQWQLDELLEATRLSPSSYGLQPYKILVISSQTLRERLVPFAFSQQQVSSSSHLLVFATRTDINTSLVDEYVSLASTKKGASPDSLAGYAEMAKSAINGMTKAQREQWAQQQTFVALGNMLTSAAMMEIDTCPIGGFEPDAFDRVLGLEAQQLTTTVICPIGRRDPSDKYGHYEKVRFDKNHLVMEQ